MRGQTSLDSNLKKTSPGGGEAQPSRETRRRRDAQPSRTAICPSRRGRDALAGTAKPSRRGREALAGAAMPSRRGRDALAGAA
ncbi:hypothetical protein MA16_Dca000348 [Dendrobium catenatum]|uniref:Uncharacterized protein n=1 Tax=Dendrobium catenatum TaxID=906689 RepID=A0A2I0WTL8_9ASPA|nr:hypothetical protein MA16_Dca000348 [Dendrobium catenatum]